MGAVWVPSALRKCALFPPSLPQLVDDESRSKNIDAHIQTHRQKNGQRSVAGGKQLGGFEGGFIWPEEFCLMNAGRCLAASRSGSHGRTVQYPTSSSLTGAQVFVRSRFILALFALC